MWRSIIVAILLPLASGRRGPRGTVIDAAYFDYIVVGAGAAGSTVAGRLALAGNDVLLVEAGGDPGLLSKIPYAATALQGSGIDWFYKTISNNKSCLSARGRQCRFSRGRCLGGSTSTNYMMYIRGNRHDYDFNVPGWSWSDLKPYFLRFEGLPNLNRLPPSSYPYHNTSGPVQINYFDKSDNPWRQRIMKGLMSLKFPYNSDVNARSQIGVTQVLGYVYGGERVTTATAYLNKNGVTSKLKIASYYKCTGIIIDENNVARGVTAVRRKDNRTTTMAFYVKQEVILTAGTVGSAQLLLLSGIGPADHLNKLGIPVRADLPVGKDMSDHVLPLMFVKVDKVSKPAPNLSFLGEIGAEAIQWLITHSGNLASIGVSDIVSFANTHCYDFITRTLGSNGPECELPNLQIIFAYIDRYSIQFAPYVVRRIFGKGVSDQIFDANGSSALLVVSPILLQPKSRGWIRLSSADPMASPNITPNYLDDERDVEEIAKSVAIVEHMVQTPAFTQYNASILRLKFPKCSETDQADYWKCYIRHMTNSAYHAVGTVALGTVLDERLRVRGVKRLRVGDLSILPRIPRGNTAAVAIAIGERLADLLQEDN